MQHVTHRFNNRLEAYLRRLIIHIYTRKIYNWIKIAILHQINNKILKCNLLTCSSIGKHLMP